MFTEINKAYKLVTVHSQDVRQIGNYSLQWWMFRPDYIREFKSAYGQYSCKYKHKEAAATYRIVVYQMGHVGSSSTFFSLKEKLSDVPVYHCHGLSWEHIEKGYLDIIRSKMHYNYRKRYVKKLSRLTVQADNFFAENNQNVRTKLVTLFRDPVARTLSTVFYSMPRELPSGISNMSEDEMLKAAERFLGDNFDQIIGYTRAWCDFNLKGLFEIDISAAKFSASDQDKGYKIISSDRADCLVIKLEELSRCYGQAFREYLGLDDFALVSKNVSSSKPYHSAYKRFKDNFKLPAEWLDAMYGIDYVQACYSPEEIRKSRERWSIIS